jgi:hypothetical protein
MKYLILIYSNPRSRAAWAGISDDRLIEIGRAHQALNRELTEAGELVASAGLADAALGTRVQVRDGRVLTSDGPFAEAKEHLAGFYLIECDGLDRAIEHAARIPDARYGGVEVRPVLPPGEPVP